MILTLAGCVEVSGGAVELSWTIRDSEGNPCACQDAEIRWIELLASPCDRVAADGSCLTVDGSGDAGPATPARTHRWDCESAHGTTGFDIEEGRWAFEIRGAQADGSDAPVRVPSPIVRDVLSGEVAQLDALLIEKLGSTCQ